MHAAGLGLSDTGRRRDSNEDYILVDNDVGLYVVCDGMGGHASGEVASKLTVETVAGYVRERLGVIEGVRQGARPYDDAVLVVEEAVQTACREVYDSARRTPELAGMGTTITLLLFVGDRAVMGHVGDSRLYVCRYGTVHQLSRDHTMVAELLRAQALKPDEARQSPFSHVLTRAVGPQESVNVDTLLIDVVPGDRYLLCSDGLADYLDDTTVLGRFLAGDVDGIPSTLVEYANSAGGQDNISVVVVRAHPTEDMSETTEEILTKQAALRAVFLFEDLTLTHLQRVMNVSELVERPAGRTLVREGEPASELHHVISGRLGVFRKGERVGTIEAGELAGATLLFRPRAARCTLKTETECELLVIDREQFQDLLRRRPWLGVHILNHLGSSMCDMMIQAQETIPQLGAACDWV